MIEPTVGRVVWIHRSTAFDKSQPETAIITYVHSSTRINAVCFSANGEPFPATSLQLVQGDEEREHIWAEWMPFQKGQAAKTEQLESQLEAVGAGGASSAS